MPRDLEVYIQRRGRDARKIEMVVPSDKYPHEVEHDGRTFHFRYADLSRGYAIYHEDKPIVWTKDE